MIQRCFFWNWYSGKLFSCWGVHLLVSYGFHFVFIGAVPSWCKDRSKKVVFSESCSWEKLALLLHLCALSTETKMRHVIFNRSSGLHNQWFKMFRPASRINCLDQYPIPNKKKTCFQVCGVFSLMTLTCKRFCQYPIRCYILEGSRRQSCRVRIQDSQKLMVRCFCQQMPPVIHWGKKKINKNHQKAPTNYIFS